MPRSVQRELGPFSTAFRRSSATDLLFVGAYIGTTFIRILAVPALKIAVVDLLLLVAIIVGMRYLRPANPAFSLFRRALPWAWLYILANLLAMLPTGLLGWALDQLARDLFVLVTFFVFLAYFIAREPARQLVALVLPIIAVWLSMATFFSTGGVRQGGYFDNPNYAAHFIVAATICVMTGNYSRRLKVVILILTAPGILATGSFAAFIFLGASSLYSIWHLMGRFTLQMKTVVRLIVVCALPFLILAGWGKFQEVEESGGSVGNIDTARFDRSSGLRTKLWGTAAAVAVEHPLGIGNGGFVQRTDIVPATEGYGHLEVHNDYLAILVESGILGLIGITGVVVVVWRAGRPGGPTRVLLIGVLATGLTREVINFRHSWVLLALVLANEWTTARLRPDSQPDGRVATGEPQGAFAPRHVV